MEEIDLTIWNNRFYVVPWPVCYYIIPNDWKDTRSIKHGFLLSLAAFLGHGLYSEFSHANKANLQVSISSDGSISGLPLCFVIFPDSRGVLYIKKIPPSAASGYGMQIQSDSHRF